MVSETLSTATTKVSQTLANIKEYVQENPASSALGIFSALVLVGAIYYRRDKPLLKDENDQ